MGVVAGITKSYSGMASLGLKIPGDGVTSAKGFFTQENPAKEIAPLAEATMAVRAATTRYCTGIILLQRRAAGDGAKSAKGFFTHEIPVREDAPLAKAMMAAGVVHMASAGSDQLWLPHPPSRGRSILRRCRDRLRLRHLLLRHLLLRPPRAWRCISNICR
jgi:hypothetical protein